MSARPVLLGLELLDDAIPLSYYVGYPPFEGRFFRNPVSYRIFHDL
jgi:hypothetical protein